MARKCEICGQPIIDPEDLYICSWCCAVVCKDCLISTEKADVCQTCFELELED